MLTGKQAIYKGQVFATTTALAKALDEAFTLRAKSHDNSWEKNEATRMVEDIERWLNCWRKYSETVRLDPSKINCFWGVEIQSVGKEGKCQK